MRTFLVRSSFALAVLLLAACGQSATPPTGACAAAYTPAVIAIVTDSLTGLAPAGTPSGLAQTGAYVDTLRPWSGVQTTMAGGGIAGTYSVHIALAGYADWNRSNIAVTPSGFCGELNSVTLHANLVPTP